MKLYGVCIGTRNCEAMVKFYERVFGYEPYSDGPDHRFLDAQLIIFDLEYMNDKNTPPANTALVYNVDDVEMEYTRLSGLGIASEPPADKPWGVRSFTINDPDGNVVSFFENL